MRERSPLPDSIANAPEVWLGLELYFDAFWSLTSSRQIGWGIGPIPWGVVHEYAKAHELDEIQEEWLHHLVAAMDQAYISFHQPKQAKTPIAAQPDQKRRGVSRWLPRVR